MRWQVHLLPDLPVVETTYAGLLSKVELEFAVRATLSTAKSHAVNLFLGDCTLLKGANSIDDLCFLIKYIKTDKRLELLLYKINKGVDL